MEQKLEIEVESDPMIHFIGGNCPQNRLK